MTEDLIPRLMEDLTSEWQEEVQSAMHALASLGQSVVLPLLDAVEGREPTLRRHAALVLEQLQPQEAIPPLIELLTEEYVPLESKLILVRVLVSLMEEGDTHEGLLTLLTILSNEQAADVRQVAATGLGKSNSVGGNVELCRLAQDPDDAVRTEAQHQLTSRSREKKANGIVPLEPAMLEAAARLLVRGGLSGSRKDAITNLLSEGENTARDLLPLLIDAGAKTLQEVTPLLQQINDAKAHMPLIDIVVDRETPWPRRQMALRSLHKLKEGEPFLEELFRSLLSDPQGELRAEAIANLAGANVEDLMGVLIEALQDESAEVRNQASVFLAESLTPVDKSRIGPLLDALNQHPKDTGRLNLLQGLSQVLLGAPGDHLFVPEIIDLLDPSDDEAFNVALNTLEKIVPRTASAQTSRSLLSLLATIANPEYVEKLLAILVRVLPRNTSEATTPLTDLLVRFDTLPIIAFVLRLLGRIADQAAAEMLIAFATDAHPKANETLVKLAQQLIEQLEGTLCEIRLEGGTYTVSRGLVCQCSERLTWKLVGEREILQCETCQDEYIVINDEPVMLPNVVTPICTCCLRKYALTQEAGELYRCSSSQTQYVTRIDTNELVPVNALQFGLCECCENPQPLALRGDDIVCIRTSRRPRDTQEHATNDFKDTIETPMPTFSVNDTSAHPRPRPARSNRTTRQTLNGVNAPTTQTRIRSFQLRQALLTDTPAPPTQAPITATSGPDMSAPQTPIAQTNPDADTKAED